MCILFFSQYFEEKQFHAVQRPQSILGTILISSVLLIPNLGAVNKFCLDWGYFKEIGVGINRVEEDLDLH